MPCHLRFIGDDDEIMSKVRKLLTCTPRTCTSPKHESEHPCKKRKVMESDAVQLSLMMMMGGVIH